MIKQKRFVSYALVLYYVPLYAPSMVYNFRIAQVTKQPILEQAQNKPHTIVLLPFDQYRKKYDGTTQNFLGGLASYIYTFSSYYFRIDGALSSIREKTGDTPVFSDTETDDILFTLGRNVALHDRASITASGLFGIPTHKVFRLQHLDFGTSQVGIGGQLDGLYALTPLHDVVYGFRYIYFVPRNGHDTCHKTYRLTIGNVADILVAYKNHWKQHGTEFGYTSRFRFGAHSDPHMHNFAQKTNYIRNSVYFVYKYKFLLHELPNRLLFNIAYGFDSSPKTFGNKNIMMLWASWNINF